MKFKEYREKYQYKLKDDVFIGYFFSVPISYIFNCLFYSENLIPNYISFAMLCCGFIGGFLFSFQNLYLMIVGYVFMHLWFVFDAWDGAVARQTKKFSKYGKEFDYVVHLLVHPVMIFGISRHLENISIFLNISSSLIIMTYLIVNIIKRGLYLLSFSRNHDIGTGTARNYHWYQYIVDFFSNAPNFILIAPVLIFLKISFGYFILPFLFFDAFSVLIQVRHYVKVYLAD